MNDFFDTSLLKEFRELINSSNVFSDVPEYRHYWNLICVLLDRLDSAVNFLNQHDAQPETEEELVFYLVYASILKDGIYKFHENIYGIKPKTTEHKKWFKNAHYYSKLLFGDDNCPTDDALFEYLRSLAFAHPFETGKRNNRPFMEEGEIHCSPWVIPSSVFNFEKDSIGVRVYSNKTDDIKDIFVSFKSLKMYLLEKYNLLKVFIKWGKEEIIKQNNKWMENKVNRSGTPIEILTDVCKVLENRLKNSYTIEDAISILKANFKCEQNENALNIVKERIIVEIDKVCDCVDRLDYEEMEEHLSFLYERPKQMHQHAHYELEKIYSYLGEERGPCIRGSNEEWGLIQAKLFYDAFAKKYVVIDFNTMSYREIKILITISLILGKMEESKNDEQ